MYFLFVCETKVLFPFFLHFLQPTLSPQHTVNQIGTPPVLNCWLINIILIINIFSKGPLFHILGRPTLAVGTILRKKRRNEYFMMKLNGSGLEPPVDSCGTACGVTSVWLNFSSRTSTSIFFLYSPVTTCQLSLHWGLMRDNNTGERHLPSKMWHLIHRVHRGFAEP